MCNYAKYTGFIRSEEQLACVNDEFLGLVKELNSIKGVGTKGASYSGSITKLWNNEYYLDLNSVLRVILMPEKDHVNNLLNIIYKHFKQDEDARLIVDDNKNAFFNCPEYKPGIELADYKIAQLKEGFAIMTHLFVEGDNIIPEELKYKSLSIKEHHELINKAKQILKKTTLFWQSLEDRVRKFNQEHGFNEVDYEKKEFKPIK